MNTNIKMVVADLDGTMLSDDKTICKENLAAVEELRKAGIIVTVATGRSFIMAQRYFDELSLDTVVATYNGGLVYNLGQKKDISVTSFSDETVNDFVDFVRGRTDDVFIYSRECLYANIESEHIRRFYTYNKTAQQTKDTLPIYSSKEFFAKEKKDAILKFGLQNDNIPQLLEWFEILKTNPNFTIVNSMPNFLEIMPKGVSKGSALQHFSDFYGISVDNMAVFGDEENDASMFEVAGFSFVMGNARDNVKKYGDYVVGDNNHAGFADGVRKYIL